MKNDFNKCFANGGEECNCEILTEKLCKTKGRCKFFKTKEQYEKDKADYDFINQLKGVL